MSFWNVSMKEQSAVPVVALAGSPEVWTGTTSWLPVTNSHWPPTQSPSASATSTRKVTWVWTPGLGFPGVYDTRRFEMVGAFDDGPDPPSLPQAAARRATPSGHSGSCRADRLGANVSHDSILRADDRSVNSALPGRLNLPSGQAALHSGRFAGRRADNANPRGHIGDR